MNWNWKDRSVKIKSSATIVVAKWLLLRQTRRITGKKRTLFGVAFSLGVLPLLFLASIMAPFFSKRLTKLFQLSHPLIANSLEMQRKWSGVRPYLSLALTSAAFFKSKAGRCRSDCRFCNYLYAQQIEWSRSISIFTLRSARFFTKNFRLSFTVSFVKSDYIKC